MPSTTTSNGAMDSLSEQFEGISISGTPNTGISPNTSRQMSSASQSATPRTPDLAVHAATVSRNPDAAVRALAAPTPAPAAMAQPKMNNSLSSSKYADSEAPAQPPSRSLSARGPGSWAYKRGADIPGKKSTGSSTQSGAFVSMPPPSGIRASVLPGTNVFEPDRTPPTPLSPYYFWSVADQFQANAMAAGITTSMPSSVPVPYSPLSMSRNDAASMASQSPHAPSPMTDTSASSEKVRIKWLRYLRETEPHASQNSSEDVVDSVTKRTGASELPSSGSALQDRTNRNLREGTTTQALQSVALPGFVSASTAITPAISPAPKVTASPAPKVTASPAQKVAESSAPTSTSIVWTPKRPTTQHVVAASTESPVQSQAPVATAAPKPATAKAAVTTAPATSVGPTPVKTAAKPEAAPAVSSTSKSHGAVPPISVGLASTAKSAQNLAASKAPGIQAQTSASHTQTREATGEAANNQKSHASSTHEQQMRLARELQASFSKSGGKPKGGRPHAESANRGYSSSRSAAPGPSMQPSNRAGKGPQSDPNLRTTSSLNPGGNDLHGNGKGRGSKSTPPVSAVNRSSSGGGGKVPTSLSSQHGKPSTMGGSAIVSRNAPPVKPTPLPLPRNHGKAPGQTSKDEPLHPSVAEGIAELAKVFNKNIGIEGDGGDPDSKAKLAEAGFLEKWPAPPIRRGPDPNQRRVTISGFTDRGSPALVFSIVWGGMVELVEFEDGSPTADVVFLRHRDCMEYYEVTASKIRIRDEEYTVKLADKLDPPHPDYDKWAAARATRCIRATPLPRAFSLKQLMRMGKVYNLENLQSGADWCLWIFMGIEGSFKFRATLDENPAFQGITFTFAQDPCAEAVGVHAE